MAFISTLSPSTPLLSPSHLMPCHCYDVIAMMPWALMICSYKSTGLWGCKQWTRKCTSLFVCLMAMRWTWHTPPRQLCAHKTSHFLRRSVVAVCAFNSLCLYLCVLPKAWCLSYHKVLSYCKLSLILLGVSPVTRCLTYCKRSLLSQGVFCIARLHHTAMCISYHKAYFFLQGVFPIARCLSCCKVLFYHKMYLILQCFTRKLSPIKKCLTIAIAYSKESWFLSYYHLPLSCPY